MPRGPWEPFDPDVWRGDAMRSVPRPTSYWDAGVQSPMDPAPHIAMPPTTFRTISTGVVGASLLPIGTPQAVSIATSAPFRRRVLVLNRAATDVAIAPSGGDLDTAQPGARPPTSYVVEAQRPAVFALDAGESLAAAGIGAAGTVSVAVSAEIPAIRPPAGVPLGATSMRNHRLQAAGTPNGATRIAPATAFPQRVIVAASGAACRVAESATELESSAAPSYAFTFDDLSGPLIFILAPRQSLFATISVAAPISVSVSSIDPSAPRGLTGVPGAGGQE